MSVSVDASGIMLKLGEKRMTKFLVTFKDFLRVYSELTSMDDQSQTAMSNTRILQRLMSKLYERDVYTKVVDDIKAC